MGSTCGSSGGRGQKEGCSVPVPPVCKPYPANDRCPQKAELAKQRGFLCGFLEAQTNTEHP